ncbi:MAG: DUF2004 domain-containing protein [Thermoplasmataceae archaeon]
MEKGLEISFQLKNDREGQETVLALGNLTGNDMKDELDIDWRIFHVTLGENKFFKVLYTGKKVGKLHPGVEKRIREHFDHLSKMGLNDLLRQYKEKQTDSNFKKVDIKELKEEYDLWQDKFWLYF